MGNWRPGALFDPWGRFDSRERPKQAGGSRSSMVVIRFDDSELDALRTESSAPDAEDMSEIRVSNVEPEEDPSEDCEEESEEMEAEAGEVAGEEGAGRDGGEAAPVSAEMLDVFDSSSPLPSASGVGVHVDVLRGLASIHGRVSHARFAAPPHVLAAPRWRRIELRKVWAAKLVQERWGRRRHYRTLLSAEDDHPLFETCPKFRDKIPEESFLKVNHAS